MPGLFGGPTDIEPRGYAAMLEALAGGMGGIQAPSLVQPPSMAGGVAAAIGGPAVERLEAQMAQRAEAEPSVEEIAADRGGLFDVREEGDLRRGRARQELERLGAFREIAEGLGRMGEMTTAGEILLGRAPESFRAEGIRDLMRRAEVRDAQEREQMTAEAIAGGKQRLGMRDALLTERKRILSDTRVRQLKSFRDASKTVMKLVKSGNPLAAKNAAIKLARAMGDVGMLSNLDIQRWTKRPGWVGTVDQLTEFFTNAPAEGLLDQMHDTAEEIYAHNINMLDTERQAAMSSFQEFNPGAPTRPLENLFGPERPKAVSAARPPTAAATTGAAAGEFVATNPDDPTDSRAFKDTPAERARVQAANWIID